MARPIKGIEFNGLVAEKAFDANWMITELNQRGAEIVILQKVSRTGPLPVRCCKTDTSLAATMNLSRPWSKSKFSG